MSAATRAIATLFGVGVGIALASCGRSEQHAAGGGAGATSASPAAPAPSAPLVVVAEPDRSSSALALGTIGERRVAVIADEDTAHLRVVELPGGAELASEKLAGTPGHLVVDARGVVWVALRDADRVESFTLSCGAGEACSLAMGKSIATAREPVALALARDGAALFVASAWGRELARYALPSGEKTAATPLPREPRALLLAKSGDALAVAHASGSVVTVATLTAGSLPTRELALDYRDHVYDLGTPTPVSDEPRFVAQGFALARADTRVLAPMVVAYPGDLVASPSYGSPRDDAFFPHETAIASLDESFAPGIAPRIRSRATVFGADTSRISRGRVEWPKETPPCLLPRAVAVDALRRSILVACVGIDQIAEIDAGDTPLVDAMRSRWRVPRGPVAIAVDGARREAWVWSLFDHKLSRLALPPVDAPFAIRDADAPLAVASDGKLGDEWSAGRALFHTPLAFDGRACASCHPDARTDGLTWSSPSGPLQTPMLAGRVGDGAPFGWLGDGATLEAHLAQTLKRLRARPLSDTELHALVAYLPRARTYLSTPARSPDEERGRAIFESGEAGCTQCHHDGGRTGDGARHDVGTGGAFDTPSLRFASGTAPYMHDGRYSTLREVLVRTEGKMGTTKHLREPDLLALIAYLRSI